MYMFAEKLHKLCNGWFSDLFMWVGPDCEMLGGCTQGKMKAKECKDANIPNFEK